MMLCTFGAFVPYFVSNQIFSKIQQGYPCSSFRSVNRLNEYYYRPQPGLPQQQHMQYQDPSLVMPVQQFPGGQGLGGVGGLGGLGGLGGGGSQSFRIDRLEREVNFLQRQTRNLERRVDRIERRLGLSQF
ncbi:MAG: hypothetical protein K0R18_1886 [Bacillales bacterium]|jgi:hypothetical protein|nr:hypothetical protein [Bacillales bacterium]